MQIYKRTVFSVIRGVIIAPFTGLAVFVVGQFFLPRLLGLLGLVGLIVALAVLYVTVFSENIRFELDSDGKFRYYKMGKLKNEFKLQGYGIGYRSKTERGLLGSSYINLKLQDEHGELTEIDAGPLGNTQFHKMFEEMEKFTATDAETLSVNTGKK
jgi:hypothetical protein